MVSTHTPPDEAAPNMGRHMDLRKRHTVTALAAMALVVSGAGTSSAASTADVVNTFQNQATGGCLDSSYVNANRTNGCGTPEQNWNVHKYNDGTVELRAITNWDFCLGHDGIALRMQYCDNSQGQSWIVKHWLDHTIRFENQQAAYYCIDDNQIQGMRLMPCSSATYQSWY